IEPQIEYNFEKFLPDKISNIFQCNIDKSNINLNRIEYRQIDYQFLSKNVLFNQFFSLFHFS
ncbi:unnamed protein product, partial [Rotaria sp. Silwood1]